MLENPRYRPGSFRATSFDALVPAAIAARAEDVGAAKARLGSATLFVLAVLAGAFIALGAVVANLAGSGSAGMLPYGVVRLIAGTAFSLGLILVIIGGAELFTGNALMVMAWANRRIRGVDLIRAWSIVLLGNAVGACGTAMLVLLADHHLLGNGAVGLAALDAASAKADLAPVAAFFRGVLCNVLVCLAVWLSLGAHSTIDKILAIVPPIAAFVAAGFEHSIANLYIVPYGILIMATADQTFWTDIGRAAADYSSLSVGGFLRNIIPVTLGNVFGGTVLVAGVYWFAYLRKADKT